ncbi:hypothetical protein N9B79_01485, partial [bacterium]|nr:hypothetical protein [bacterium]
MKYTLALFCACMVIASMIAAVKANRIDDIRTRILRLFPRADTNGDGVISDKEEAALGHLVLGSYPNADADGDGVLSRQEKHVLLNMASQKPHRNPRDRSSLTLAEVTRSEEAKNATTPPDSPVRRGPQLI